tara:strand:+ start:1224 stop:2867 length:1644 start_codon:yes stop_codon:yes gene_type:complete
MNQKKISKFYITILQLTSLLILYINPNNAFSSSEDDLFTYYQKSFDESLHNYDFYTNEIFYKNNGRQFFANIVVLLSKVFNIEWSLVIFILKIFLVLFLPYLMFIFLEIFIEKFTEINNLTLFLIFLSIFFCITPYAPKHSSTFPEIFFSVAWWGPYVTSVIPRSFAFCFTLFGIIYFERKKISIYLLSLVSFISFFIQPVSHLLVITFYLSFKLIENKKDFFKLAKYIGLTNILSYLIFIFRNDSSVALTNSEFVKIYAVNNHAAHYLPSNFGSFSIFVNWQYSFVLLIIVMTLSSLFLYKKKQKKAFNLSLVFIFMTLFTLLSQYIFIEIIPIKQIAAFSPIRYSRFYYWELIFLLVLCFNKYEYKFIKLFNRFNKKINKLSSKYFIITILLTTSLVLTSYINPVSQRYENDRELYDFILLTDESSVFVVPYSNLMRDIPIVAKRAVLNNISFPFIESSLREHNKRMVSFFGERVERDTIGGSWEGEKIQNYYRSLEPKEFFLISENLDFDYIIIEKNSSSKFNNLNPIFESDKYFIYTASDLDE